MEMKKLIKVILLAWFAMSGADVPASVLSEWYHDHPTNNLNQLTAIIVGNEYVKITKEIRQEGYYAFQTPGAYAELIATEYGWKLKLGGADVGGGQILGCIQACGNLAIELESGKATTVTHLTGGIGMSDRVGLMGGDKRSGEGYQNDNNGWAIRCTDSLLIYGRGTLTVFNFEDRKDGIFSEDEYKCGVRAGTLRIAGGSSVSIQTAGPSAYRGGGMSVRGAMLETRHGGIWAGNSVSFDRAVVNVLSRGAGVSAWGDLTINSTYGVFIAKTGNALYTRRALTLDNSIVYAMSSSNSCARVHYNDEDIPSTIGRGIYKFATMGAGKAAVEFAGPLRLNGGELVTCTPGGYGLYSVVDPVTVNSGLVRNKFSMDIKKDFFVSREILDAYGLVNSWATLAGEGDFAPYDAIGTFLGETLLNWITTESIDNPSGLAKSVVRLVSSSLKLNGGTILSENTEHGVGLGMEKTARIYGGSLQGPIKKNTATGRLVDGYPPIDAMTNSLVCVTNTVAAEPYALVKSGWTAKLPPGYDTSSLYLDGQSKLYFWVPPEYVEPEFCTVTFNANGGMGGTTRTVTAGGALGELPSNPTRDGYTFDGWYTAASGGSQVTAATIVTGDITYYAQWTKNAEPAPVTPTPVTPAPVTPDPVTPDPEPVAPCYAVLNASDITAPYAAEKAVTLQGVVYDGGDGAVVGIVELKLGKVNEKKHTGKVSGSLTTLDGKKHMIKALNLTEIDGTSSKAVSLEVKDFGTMAVTIGGTQFAGSMGKYHVQSATVGGNWSKGGAKAYVATTSATLPAGTQERLLPAGEPVEAANGKWKFAKAAGVKWAKPKKGAEPPEIYDEESQKGLVVDTSAGKTNLSGLKLTYVPKKGTFKGSFKVYALEGSGKATKLKKYTVNVSGVVVGGVGYGTAACKRPAGGPWPVTVE